MPGKRAQKKSDTLKSLQQQIDEKKQQLSVLNEQIDRLWPTDTKWAEVENERRSVQKFLNQLQLKQARLNKSKPELRVKLPLFANRQKELKELKTLNHYHFYQIIAPAGYGKTYLLNELSKHFEKKQTWVTAKVSFAPILDNGELTKHEVITTPAGILQGLLSSLKEKPRGKSESSLLEHLVRAITSRASKNTQAQVVLFFDAIEQAQELCGWITKTLIKDLQQRATIKEVRAFFASRFKITLELGYQYMWYPLSNFTKDTLVEVISRRDPKGHISPDLKEAIAYNLLELCLGHPRCVGRILDRIGHHPKLDDGRLKDQLSIFEEEVSSTIYEQILKYTEPHVTTEALKTIFTYRKVLPSNLTELFPEEESLKSYSINSTKSAQDFVWYKLCPTGLFTPPPNKYDAYVGDPVVRHILAMELLYKNPERLVSLHQNALSIYESQLLTTDDPPTGSRQIALLTEALYHLGRSLLIEMNTLKNLEIILAKLAYWQTYWKTGEDMRSEDYRSGFMNMIREDTDLPLLLQMVGGKDGLNRVLRYIDEANLSNLA